MEEEGESWGFTIREDGNSSNSSGGSGGGGSSGRSGGSRSGSSSNSDSSSSGGDGGGRGGGGQRVAATPRGILEQCVVLRALSVLMPRLHSPGLLGALKAGPLLDGLEAAFARRDLDARQQAVVVMVEMYQVGGGMLVLLWCRKCIPVPGMNHFFLHGGNGILIPSDLFPVKVDAVPKWVFN